MLYFEHREREREREINGGSEELTRCTVFMITAAGVLCATVTMVTAPNSTASISTTTSTSDTASTDDAVSSKFWVRDVCSLESGTCVCV